MGAGLVAITAAGTATGIWLSLVDSTGIWLLGQVLLALALLQWFILLHEAGHGSLFRRRALNSACGQLAGCFALIPFACWRRVHALHHLWTGWQDLDPTTAGLAPRARSRAERLIADLAWRSWLPLFSIVYRLANYWHLPRLRRLFPASGQRLDMLLGAASLIALYAALVAMLGASTLLQLCGLALLLALALQDPLILSQHTHIAQPLSAGRKVAPLSGAEQERYTRSLRFPPWVARWLLFGFNAHELHHRHPGVPGYRLHRIAHRCANEVPWWHWLVACKRLRGSVFVFETRDSTGFKG